MTKKEPQVEPIMCKPVGYRGIVIQAISLMALWLIMSGHFDLEHIFYGAVSVALVVWLNTRIRPIPLHSGECIVARCINIPRLIAYLIWLLGQIIKSGVQVAYLVLHPKMPINPVMVHFESILPTPLAHVILGNSITLTPGTLTVDVKGDYFVVHALTPDIEEDLVNGEMEARVGRLYLEECTPGDMCTNVCLLESTREAKKRIQAKGDQK
jgi:multicomponent Na+:H+ antiporter subunit E